MMDRLQCVLHNHPSGDPAPSRADVQMTQAIVDITKRLGIAVHDHIIVGKETGRLPVGKPRPANRSSRKQPKQIAAVHESGNGPSRQIVHWLASDRARVRVVHGERLVGEALRMAARDDQSQMASRLANGKSPGW